MAEQVLRPQDHQKCLSSRKSNFLNQTLYIQELVVAEPSVES